MHFGMPTDITVSWQDTLLILTDFFSHPLPYFSGHLFVILFYGHGVFRTSPKALGLASPEFPMCSLSSVFHLESLSVGSGRHPLPQSSLPSASSFLETLVILGCLLPEEMCPLDQGAGPPGPSAVCAVCARG